MNQPDNRLLQQTKEELAAAEGSISEQFDLLWQVPSTAVKQLLEDVESLQLVQQQIAGQIALVAEQCRCHAESLTAAQTQCQQLWNKYQDSWQRKYDEIRAAQEFSDQQLVACQHELANVEANRNQLDSHVDESNKRAEALEAELAEAKAEQVKWQAANSQMQEKLSEAESKHASVIGECEIQKELAAQWQKSAAESQHLMASLTEDNASLLAQVDCLQAKLASVSEEVAAERARSEQLELLLGQDYELKNAENTGSAAVLASVPASVDSAAFDQAVAEHPSVDDGLGIAAQAFEEQPTPTTDEHSELASMAQGAVAIHSGKYVGPGPVIEQDDSDSDSLLEFRPQFLPPTQASDATAEASAEPESDDEDLEWHPQVAEAKPTSSEESQPVQQPASAEPESGDDDLEWHPQVADAKPKSSEESQPVQQPASAESESGDEDLEWHPQVAEAKVTSSEENQLVQQPASAESESGDEDLEWHPEAADAKPTSSEESQPVQQPASAEPESGDEDLEWHPDAADAKPTSSEESLPIQQPASAESESGDEDLEWHPDAAEAKPTAGKESQPVQQPESAKPETSDDDLEWHPPVEGEQTTRPIKEDHCEIDFHHAVMLEELAAASGVSVDDVDWKPGEVKAIGVKLDEKDLEWKPEQNKAQPRVARIRGNDSEQHAVTMPVHLRNHIKEGQDSDSEENLDKCCDLLPRHIDSPRFVVTEDQEIIQAVEHAYAILANKEYDASLTLFTELADKYTEVLQVQKGLFDQYVASLCWDKACQQGHDIIYDVSMTADWPDFVDKLRRALAEYLDVCNEMGERKRMLVTRAETYLGEPKFALQYLREALSIPGEIAEEAHIHYYLVRLAPDSSRYRFEDVVGALQDVDNSPVLFDDLVGISQEDSYRGHLPVVKVINAIYRHGREKAKEVEEACQCKAEVCAVPLNPALIEEIHDDTSDMVIEFFLGQLFPRADIKIPAPPDRSLQLLSESIDVPFGFSPASTLERLNRRLFRMRDYECKVYEGSDPIWVEAVIGKTVSFIMNADLASLTSVEQQFLILRKLFQVHHRHMELWRIRELLTDETRCQLLRLTRDIVEETGTKISNELENEINELKPGVPHLQRTIYDCLGRLHKHSLAREFVLLKDYFFSRMPFVAILDSAADRFATKFVGMTDGSYGLARLLVGRTPVFGQIEQEGFQVLYRSDEPQYSSLRKRLQRVWTAPFVDGMW